jgi:uncharacterized protein (TIGR02646 family)
MRPITKGPEPESLTEHRAKPHADYDNYAEKNDLRVSLVGEQGALCCYCMQRIYAHIDRMKIEHWLCQEDHEERSLDYGNLLGACLGGEGKPYRFQHCDTRKGMRSLCRNPAAMPPAVDRDIRYLANGTIRSDDADFDAELNDVLNLNVERLKNNRKAVLDGLKAWAEKVGKLRKADIRAELKGWDEMGGGVLREYAQVAIFWLNRRLNKFEP